MPAATVVNPMMSPGAGANGQRLGRYHLAEPLGGGPTGEVFRAKVYGVAGFERQFAVKRFHAQFVKDPDTAAAIATAARNYGSLEHQRIARLNEYGVTGGVTFTATELVEGVDLARLMSIANSMGRPLPPGAASSLISQAARALGYAHGRGIFHLGLCLTNLIATSEGEVKLTDFGFLPPRLPARPSSDTSLYARIPYLAPEQLAGESTSAATDVFQLGSITYELLAGKPAFSGSSAQEVAQRVLSDKPSPPSVPKPLVQVLQRCMARSPFERYPDARALADALDAAVRAAPLPGSAQDLGATVRLTLQHIQELTGDQVSGAVSFPLPAPPRTSPGVQLDEDSEAGLRTQPLAARKPGAGNEAPVERPPTELPQTKVVEYGSLSNAPSLDDNAPTSKVAKGERGAVSGQTLRGIEAPGVPPVKMPPLLENPGSEMDEEVPTRIRERDKGFVTVPAGPSSRPAASSGVGSRTTGDIPTVVRPPPSEMNEFAPSDHNRATEANTATPRPPGAPPQSATLGGPPPVPVTPPTPSGRTHAVHPPAPASDAQLPPHVSPLGTGSPAAQQASPDSHPPIIAEPPPGRGDESFTALPAPPGTVPPIPGASGPSLYPQAPAGSVPQMMAPDPSGQQLYPYPQAPNLGMPGNPQAVAASGRRNSGMWKLLAAVLIFGAIGAGGYIAYDEFVAENPVVAGSGAAAENGDAGAQAVVDGTSGRDAGGAVVSSDGGPGDAGTNLVADPADDVDASTDVQPRPTKLIIRSEPSRARVYLDGARLGKSPVTLDATDDRHQLAVVLSGHTLYTDEIDGYGTVEIELEPITPPEGPAGIKVRCRKKNRYYVFVDGVATGQLCPTERIGVTLGEHTVEIYDPVTDSRRTFNANVVDTHRSLRIRVD